MSDSTPEPQPTPETVARMVQITREHDSFDVHDFALMAARVADAMVASERANIAEAVKCIGIARADLREQDYRKADAWLDAALAELEANHD